MYYLEMNIVLSNTLLFSYIVIVQQLPAKLEEIAPLEVDRVAQA